MERKDPEYEPAQRFAPEVLEWKIFELPQELGEGLSEMPMVKYKSHVDISTVVKPQYLGFILC
ncbi:MAG: hypothetical protein WBB27_02990 [Maribacter sp.]